MLGAERLLLECGRFAQELLGDRVVAGRGRLFGAFDDRADFAQLRHSISEEDPINPEGELRPIVKQGSGIVLILSDR